MEDYGIYNDISQRTDGSIYIGVVGPVRTGKSTFIKKFMETLVLPNIPNEYSRQRAKDELPQSASGNTIMTTEPKFIPNEAVEIKLQNNASFKVRLIDCVGYIVEGALGYLEENAPRMITTPWFEEPIPFNKAAEIGTKKVITEHSTIGLVVTTDGSICGISRQDYVPAEEKMIKELKEINKPFIVLLNSTNPNGTGAQQLRFELEQKYDVPVMAVNCLQLNQSDIFAIIETVLFEFGIQEIKISLPGYTEPLANDHWLKKELYTVILESTKNIRKIREINGAMDHIAECDYIDDLSVLSTNLGNGKVIIGVRLKNDVYYKILSEAAATEITSDAQLMKFVTELSDVQKKYNKVAYALEEVKSKGYGIVTPDIDELVLEEPQIVKHGGRFGVKLRASAPSIHVA